MRADLLRRTRQQSLLRRRTVLAERRAARIGAGPGQDRSQRQERSDDR